MNSHPYLIRSDSALFIDRDGVINKRIPDGYVRKTSEFIFLPGTLEAFEIFRELFKRIIIVTNQQGIGKGLMIDSIDDIHAYFLSLIPLEIHPDKIYYCPHLKESNCVCRKPKPGMALMAKNDFPDINLSSSIMVGDSKSDIEFGENAGMRTALIYGKEDTSTPGFTNLLEFAQLLRNN